MARGWESKSVESQIEDRAAARSASRNDVDAAESELTRRRERLEQQKRRIARDLQAAKSEVHKVALNNALAFLDSELADLKK